jgi:phosphopantothenoylcysteine decarboxylase/phosphopantothenate--cysteine ligase
MQNFWKNKSVLITAGPTKEYLDPVRFITNESSGKMGYAIAEFIESLGANVHLVSGPIQIQHSFSVDKIIHVETANEMFEESKKLFDQVDVAIFTAAVADYKPKEKAVNKIKKKGEELEIIFVKNPDIAFEFGKVKKDNQLSIGFGLETNDLLINGTEKLEKKKFDLIVLNSPKIGEGFGYDTNKVTILDRNKKVTYYPLKSKKDIAFDLISNIEKLENEKILN